MLYIVKAGGGLKPGTWGGRSKKKKKKQVPKTGCV